MTGLIAPLELRTDSQLHFELLGGFDRGCRKEWYRVDPGGRPPDVFHLGAGRFGAGANMAFRTEVLRSLGGFDPALDVGTASEGGGDLEMFLRLLHAGETLVYEPAALVRHRHRDNAGALHAQIATWGTAIGAVLTAAFSRMPSFRSEILRFAAIWSWAGYLVPSCRSALGPGQVPRTLRLRPLLRLPIGPMRYFIARRSARRLGPWPSPMPAQRSGGTEAVGVLRYDVAEPAQSLATSAKFRACDIHVTFGDMYVGSLRIENRWRSIGAEEIRMRAAEAFTPKLLALALPARHLASLMDFVELLRDRFDAPAALELDEFSPRLVSAVIATRNRPAELARCLGALSAQSASFPFEILVVDNDPDSGLTLPIVCGFPKARYAEEPTRGLSSARNTGFRLAQGDVLATTDDDTVPPPGWLAAIVQPFRFAHVGAVTGLTCPLALDEPAQRHFESLGGLGKGPRSFEAGPNWLEAGMLRPPRAWDLGATANAAFRRSVLQEDRVGLLSECLGPGTPAGGGEDAYLFYRIVRAGWTIYYEPEAMLLHDHRRSDRALNRQMVDYARGHVSYLLTTFFRDRDLRAVYRLILVLPLWHAWRLVHRPRRATYRRRWVAAELWGYLTGPIGWALGAARAARLQREGRSRWSDPLPLAEKVAPVDVPVTA